MDEYLEFLREYRCALSEASSRARECGDLKLHGHYKAMKKSVSRCMEAYDEIMMSKYKHPEQKNPSGSCKENAAM